MFVFPTGSYRPPMLLSYQGVGESYRPGLYSNFRKTGSDADGNHSTCTAVNLLRSMKGLMRCAILRQYSLFALAFLGKGHPANVESNDPGPAGDSLPGLLGTA